MNLLKKINVVGAILIENGKILCAQRGEGKSLAYLWEFPGGKIETGETPQEALIRELQEELMIDVEVQSEKFEETSYQYDFGLVTLTTFICFLKRGTPQLTEHIAVEWLAPKELTTLEWAPADIPAVEKLMEMETIR
ncbi:(deoxy)nucleoside triphosphate pyrophosphohydrolase [Carnobacterium viridans]|uniref:8-oxo-dGTP diphosphatase n=1 Tax=Carnobacterium viridans TaxID=174587 RepID=A0A1H0ZWG7_9LACT|nr:(deoxy)nucleoside triphosphate pyrophosphohydrolase [Carnobacterium viridans]UDE94432.1 (deoxy)nucleoside triphosphate pyrophosphohydrolase [Carnobacterium viridans]SDQ31720.1 8-oxo-dGTP diphosphatase [Carnobacterium viridans]